MKEIEVKDRCPRCLMPDIRTWNELTSEEQILARRLPGSAAFTLKERKKHRFCIRCWYEDPHPIKVVA